MLPYLQRISSRILENELLRRILTNASYLLSATGLAAGMSVFQSILAGRLLGPANFGVLGAITQFTSVVNRFASFRMNELVVRYVGKYQEEGDQDRAAAVFKMASFLEFGGSILALILIWVLAPLGAHFFAQDSSLAFWFQIYGFIILANVMFETASGLLQILDRFRIMAVATAAQSAITLTLIVIIFFVKAGLTEVIVAYMIGKYVYSLSVTIASLVEARRAWGAGWWRTPLSILKEERRNLLTFAFSTNLSSTVSLVAKDSEVLWVSAFLGPVQAGYYKTALAITNLLQLPVSPLPKATFPELAREIARRNWDNVRYVLRQGSRLSAIYSVPVTLVLIIFGKWLIGVTYGPEYLPTYSALVILLVGYTFVNIFYWNRVALLSLGRAVFPTIINFTGMVLKVAAIFLLVPHYGYLAFAALLVGYYFFTVGAAAIRVFLDVRSQTQVEVTK
ncbi:MAG: oligosaccharide flippase family protein [Anaerolineales bacterium]|nr:oligosaccharide flippase family protein [Chloroflexota bacterium]MBL6980232.1 oligosaccharide flippase family protein [Anaerolineales bacterium]